MVAQLLIIQKSICFANKANSFGFLNVEFLTCIDINGWTFKNKKKPKIRWKHTTKGEI